MSNITSLIHNLNARNQYSTHELESNNEFMNWLYEVGEKHTLELTSFGSKLTAKTVTHQRDIHAKTKNFRTKDQGIL
jgi:hypothetical protein